MIKRIRSFSDGLRSFAGKQALLAVSAMMPERKPAKAEKIKRAAFFNAGPARNVVFLQPSARALKEAYPECELVFFVPKESAGIVSLIPEADGTVLLSGTKQRENVSAVKNAGSFDVCMDFGLEEGYASFPVLFANSGIKAGFKKEGSLRHLIYDKTVSFDPAVHFIENAAKLVAGIGITSLTEPKIESGMPRREKRVFYNIFADSDEHGSRNWSDESWKALIRILNSGGYAASITGDIKNAEKADKFTEELGETVDVDYLVGRLDEAELANAFGEASLVIGPDCKAIHIAAASGTPALGIYGPTSPETYGPRGSGSRALSAGLNCSGCQNTDDRARCPAGDNLCMKALTVDTVASQALAMLEGGR